MQIVKLIKTSARLTGLMMVRDLPQAVTTAMLEFGAAKAKSNKFVPVTTGLFEGLG